MTGAEIILRALHEGERRLAHDLLAAARRHHGDHEVHHVATDLAGWSHEHVERIARHRPGLPGGDAPEAEPPHPAAPAGTGQPDSRLSLLDDLRDLHLAAAENSLNREILAQLARATRDSALLDLAASCHPRTVRQMRWTDTMIKTRSPQLLADL